MRTLPKAEKLQQRWKQIHHLDDAIYTEPDSAAADDDGSPIGLDFRQEAVKTLTGVCGLKKVRKYSYAFMHDEDQIPESVVIEVEMKRFQVVAG